MAKINKLALCQGCRTELPSPFPEKCPVCQRVIVKPENEFFASPDYLSYQLEEQREDLGIHLEKGPTKSQKEDIVRMEKAFTEWLRKSPADDKVAALNDALYVMQHLLYSNLTVEELRMVNVGAKKIGALAEAIEKYLLCGGELNVRREVRSVQAESGGHAGSTATIN